MDLLELEKVHQASKQPNSNVWKIWLTEMYRKAVAKRLFKQLPLTDTFMEVINRDNQQFDMNKAPEVSSIAKDVQAHVRLAAPSQEAQLGIAEQPPLAEAIEANEKRLDDIQRKVIQSEPVVVHHSEPEQEQEPSRTEDDWPKDELAGMGTQPTEPDF
jgi:hypothetical protein